MEYNVTNFVEEEIDYDDGVDHFERVMKIGVPVIYSLIAIIGFVGNLLVIIVVLSNRNMHTPTYVLIANLALADLGFIIFCIPFVTVSLTVAVWPFGDVWCRIVQYATFVTAYASIYTLALIALDRYLLLAHPRTSANFRTDRNACIGVAIMWLVLLAVNIPVCFTYRVMTYHYKEQERAACILYYDNGKDLFSTFIAFGFVVPLLLIIILYAFMLIGMRSSPDTDDRQESEEKSRVTCMVAVLVLAFVICWLPNHVCLMISFWNRPENKLFYHIHVFVRILTFANSCINPFLYAVLSERFRNGFRGMLRCGRKSKGNAGMVMAVGSTEPTLVSTGVPSNEGCI